MIKHAKAFFYTAKCCLSHLFLCGENEGCTDQPAGNCPKLPPLHSRRMFDALSRLLDRKYSFGKSFAQIEKSAREKNQILTSLPHVRVFSRRFRRKSGLLQWLVFFSSVQRETSTFCALMHIYQLLQYVLSTSFSTHPKPLT